MLTEEENELLTRIGPGTRCGELLRRYWHPVAMASELTDARPKMRLTVLGEELVLFRMRNAELGMGNAEAVPEGDSAIRTPHSAIRYGLLGEHCSHRGASLYYGFLEAGGLRCPYHGWLYDKGGRCLEQPFEPAFRWTDSGGRDSAESSGLEAQSAIRTPHSAIKHPAYPVQELGGLLFAYLGPPDKQPLLPRWDVVALPTRSTGGSPSTTPTLRSSRARSFGGAQRAAAGGGTEEGRPALRFTVRRTVNFPSIRSRARTRWRGRRRVRSSTVPGSTWAPRMPGSRSFASCLGSRSSGSNGARTRWPSCARPSGTRSSSCRAGSSRAAPRWWPPTARVHSWDTVFDDRHRVYEVPFGKARRK